MARVVNVNVKVKFIRPTYGDLREWMEDPNNVYIGRSGVILLPDHETGKKSRFPKKNSIWANPFKISSKATRETVIKQYREYISHKIASDPKMKLELEKLKGKTLGCWCAPEPCHGDILLELLEKVKNHKI